MQVGHGTPCLFPHLCDGLMLSNTQDLQAAMRAPVATPSPLSSVFCSNRCFLDGQILSYLWVFVSLVISVGQEFGSSLAGWLWLRVSQEAAVKMSARAVVI